MTLPELPEPVQRALDVASELGVLAELGDAIVAIVKGDLVLARLKAEEASVKAAARLPYLVKK